jgi:hypothetical protein
VGWRSGDLHPLSPFGHFKLLLSNGQNTLNNKRPRPDSIGSSENHDCHILGSMHGPDPALCLADLISNRDLRISKGKKVLHVPDAHHGEHLRYRPDFRLY